MTTYHKSHGSFGKIRGLVMGSADFGSPLFPASNAVGTKVLVDGFDVLGIWCHGSDNLFLLLRNILAYPCYYLRLNRKGVVMKI